MIASDEFNATFAASCDRLVANGLLRREEERIFRIFRVLRYPAADGRPEPDLRHLLREVLFHDVPATAADALLLSLLAVAGGLQQLGTKQELRPTKQRVQELRESDAVVSAIAQAVQGHLAEQAANDTMVVLMSTT